jgi:ABC-type phosphate transport system substrate-binding protein
MVGMVALQSTAGADVAGPTSFQPPAYSVGDVNGQNGWRMTGNYDVAVAPVSDFPAASGYGFGAQALRLSDAVTSGSFGDQTFSPGLADEVGESTASNAGLSGGARQTHFDARFMIGSTQASMQSGLHMSVSPDRGDGARMSYLRFEDHADGVHVFFDDVTDPGPVGTVAAFNETDIATLDRDRAHSVEFWVDLVDGQANDVVKIYIDGALKKTGGSWEDYYRFDPEQTPTGNKVPTVDRLLFRESGASDPANRGNGFLVDKIVLDSFSPPTGPDVVTAVGAATTERLMDTALAGFNAANVHAHPSTNLTAAADGYCSMVTYSSATTPGVVLAPDGSDAGRDALRDSVAGEYPDATTDVGHGCVDIARSDVGPRPVGASGDSATFEYYAYGLDAVTWASSSLDAPSSLSLQQLRDIYGCVVTDWSQVGGTPGPIQRALPPTSSGTRSAFLVDLLNLSQNAAFPSGPSCPPVVVVDENQGTALLSSTTRTSYQRYIVPYASSKWVFQANNAANPTLDTRAGVRPGGISRPTTEPIDPGVSAFPVRWVGSSWRLNDATIIGGRALDAVTSSGQFATTLTATPGAFATADVGAAVQGANVYDATTITAVTPDGSAATITPGAKTVGTATLIVGPTAVSEFNASATTPLFPGVHYVYNVLDDTTPSYLAARQLVGFDDHPNGITSNICNGILASTIDDNGYLDLRPITTPGGSTNITCRRQSP